MKLPLKSRYIMILELQQQQSQHYNHSEKSKQEFINSNTEAVQF